jgi:hypothetical protein
LTEQGLTDTLTGQGLTDTSSFKCLRGQHNTVLQVKRGTYARLCTGTGTCQLSPNQKPWCGLGLTQSRVFK